ncbi:MULTISPECIES: MarR family winged helix-turn-helix transcriptional regulator [unclassified Kitasatospora]|uniref:MarR family winged helix-turn-helix transcriptional regulator n=1 Tax=unclassified Kitasatospora TaxID=2633591 RepID=UPI001ADF4E05|nr:MarR family winged helix-turn-helix transcriptional regulator [Kitasatospora sp. RG8]MBP0450488.1 winged helix-turn-helix transcriptional regulator [Kitasatospora sp. RG8]
MEHPEQRSDEPRDWTDGHVERWQPVLPHLDPDIEGAVTRMNKLTRHLRRVREQGVADYGLQKHEFDTLHELAGRGGHALPSELRADLNLAPASVTGRLEALERRGFVVRTPSTEDRRRVDVELTEAGLEAWRQALDVVGREEQRLLGVLAPEERRLLSDLLRRVLLAAEAPDPADAPGPGGQPKPRP